MNKNKRQHMPQTSFSHQIQRNPQIGSRSSHHHHAQQQQQHRQAQINASRMQPPQQQPQVQPQAHKQAQMQQQKPHASKTISVQQKQTQIQHQQRQQAQPQPSSGAMLSAGRASGVPFPGNQGGHGLLSGPGTSGAAETAAPQIPHRLYQHVIDLSNFEKRDQALQALCQKREDHPEMAPVLWHSFGAITALLQEIVSIYPLLSPPRLTPSISNRCCNALALLQCVASHPDTRTLFLNSHLALFLYPFLNTVHSFKQYDALRLTSLGVIGGLVQVHDPDVISFLLQTEIIPLCLRIMDNGSEVSRRVATFIIQKILLDDTGLSYICATYERFSTVSSVLSKMVASIEDRSSGRLLKHIVRCYLRLSDNPRAREALRNCLPPQLRDPAFTINDQATKRWLAQLIFNISASTEQSFGGNGGVGAGVGSGPPATVSGSGAGVAAGGGNGSTVGTGMVS